MPHRTVAGAAAPVLFAILLAIPSGPAAADNRALVLGNESYAAAAPIRLGAAVSDASAALAEAGFRVFTGADLDAATMRQRLALLHTAGPRPPERTVILLAGHFARSPGQTWFLGTDAARPSLATADGVGLPLTTVLEVAAASPGGAVVLMGTETRRIGLGAGLGAGIGALAVPQGVTVISGDAGRIVEFAETALVTPGRSLPDMLADWPDLQVSGLLNPLAPFLPEGLAPGFEESVEDTDTAEDLAAWEEALATDTIAGFEAYLEARPEGRFAAEARAAIERIEADPERIEAALNLTRDQRREVQRQLSLLGFDTRGIDGIFGPGTRGAIRGWQTGRDLDETGFLSAAQIALLAQDVALREAEIAEEEARARAAAEEADRAFWRDTGAGSDEAGLRAYLSRYPEGLFAAVARERLAEIEAGRDRAAWDAARAADTPAAYRAYLADRPQGAFASAARTRLADLDAAAWGTARSTDTVAAYEAYLAAFPDGAEAATARDRIAALQAPPPPDEPGPTPDPGPDPDPAPDTDDAEAEEAALNLNRVARNLIEVQLASLGFSPGSIDGRFDADTRRALRRYQRNRNLPVSGYVTRETLRSLIGEGLPILMP